MIDATLEKSQSSSQKGVQPYPFYTGIIKQQKQNEPNKVFIGPRFFPS